MRKARSLVIAFGLVSLFGDIVYEGARGVIPSYLKLLGMSSTAVGIALGIAEFIAYASRILTGYIADRTRRHRLLIFIGYGVIAFLPALAFVYDWRIAILFIFLERFGKSLRAPARDAIIAEATESIGRGKAFGLHEAMDQIGASLGPLIVALLIARYNIRLALMALFVPYVFIILALLYAKHVHPEPGKPKGVLGLGVRPFHIAVFFNAASLFLPFLLLYALTGPVKLYEVPLIYLYINVVDALVSLIAGKAYDAIGKAVPGMAFVLSPLPALFYARKISLYIPWYIRAATFMGIVMGLRESAFRAYVADSARLSLASEYGAYYTFLGLGLAISGSVYGYLMPIKTLIPLYALVTALIAFVLFLLDR